MADLVAAFFGARNQGKSTQVKHALFTLAPSRLMVWDAMNEYGAYARPVDSLVAMGKASKADAFRLRYVPDIKNTTRKVLEDRFNSFCLLAMDRRRVLIVGEELSLVTRPGWAPPAWTACTLIGRHADYQVSILGVSQRPAHVDKDFFSNCNSVSTGRLNFAADIKVLADVLQRPYSDVANLAPYHFIARNMDTGATMNGTTDALRAQMGIKK